MDPEMAAIFKKSTAVSSKYELFKNIFNFYSIIASKGSSANLLQSGSKRRRTKQQIADEKINAQLKQ